MKYVVLTHVPAFVGQSSGVIRINSAWLDELSIQTRALTQEGFTLTVASPCFADLDARTLARHTIVDFRPADIGLSYVPLPSYRSMPQFLSRRNHLRRIAAATASEAAVVQLGPGGHPASLGQTLWPTVGRLPCRRIFAFGGDPFAAMRRYAAAGNNPAKRAAKSIMVRKREAFCWQAIKSSDLVFSYSATVAERGRHVWADHCHTFPETITRDRDLTEQLSARIARLNDPHRPIRLVCIAHADARHGVDHLIDAVAKTVRLSGRVEVDLYGNAAESTELVKRVAAAGLRSVWRFNGALSPSVLPGVLERADLWANVSIVPAPDPILDLAAAKGLPTVCYHGHDAADELAKAGGAVVVPRGDTDRLAAAFIGLARDHARLAALSRAAYKWAAGRTLDASHRDRARLARQVCESDLKRPLIVEK